MFTFRVQLTVRLNFEPVPRNFFQRLAYFLHRHPQFVVLLKIYPDIRPRAEPSAQSQNRVTANAPLAADDLRNAVCRNALFLRQQVCAHAESFQLVGQMFSSMNKKTRHPCLLVIDSQTTLVFPATGLPSDADQHVDEVKMLMVEKFQIVGAPVA